MHSKLVVLSNSSTFVFSTRIKSVGQPTTGDGFKKCIQVDDAWTRRDVRRRGDDCTRRKSTPRLDIAQVFVVRGEEDGGYGKEEEKGVVGLN